MKEQDDKLNGAPARPLNILYLYQYFGTPQGSWSTRAYELARRWVAAGDRVTVVTSVYDKSDLQADRLLSTRTIEGIEVRVINVKLSNRASKAGRIASYLAYALAATGWAATTRADVVIASSGPLTIGIPALAAARVARRPLVFEVRDVWPEGAVQLGMLTNPLAIRWSRWLEAACYRAASHVVALSPGMAEWVRRVPDAAPVTVIPNACDNDLFGSPSPAVDLPLPVTPGKCIAIYTGSLGLMDDAMQLVEAAVALRDEGADEIELVIVGDGKERDAMEARARAAGLTNIHFMGQHPKHRVAAWLGQATCALITFKNLPVLNTVSPNKFFDALASGVPVIQTTGGWLRDLIEREGCGLNVPPNDPRAMAGAIRRICGDEGLRRQMSDQARRLATGEFDRDRLAELYRDVLTQAASAAPPGRAPLSVDRRTGNEG